jgi:copper chaperone CopZ
MESLGIGLFLSVLSGVCTAVWTVLTWREQEYKEEESNRNINAALYVNPFLLVAEELQSSLYDFVSGKEIKTLENKDSESYAGFSADALEILYVIVIYFGWSFIIYRYGPYTRDRKVIELTRNISETFADCDEFSSEDAFYFSYSEQKALALTFVKAFNPTNFIQESNSIFPGFEAISLYSFEEEIKNSRNEHSAFYVNIRDVLHSIDDSKIIEDLKGRKRLVIIQNFLVDLLNYLEKKEGFTVSVKARRKANLHIKCFLNSNELEEIYKIIHHTPGRIRLRISNSHNCESYAMQLQALLKSLAGVESVRINLPAASITINYNQTIPKSEFEQQIMEVISLKETLGSRR